MIKWFFFLAITTFSCADQAKWRTEQKLRAIDAQKKSDSIEKIMDSLGKPFIQSEIYDSTQAR